MKKSAIILFALMIFISWQLNAQTWSSPKRLTWNPGWSESAVIAPEQYMNLLHVVWFEDVSGNYEIFYKRSADSGTTWSGPTRLSWTAENSETPSLAVDSCRRIHVVWYDETPGNWEIFYKRSTDSGETWLPLTRMTWTSSHSFNASISIGFNNGVHVAWHERITTTNNEIFYKRSTNGGSTWLAPVRLTWNSGRSYSPAIAADSGSRVHLVWKDDTPGNNEIFYKRSDDMGVTWSAPTRLTWSSGDVINLFLVVDSSDRVHLVYNDDTPGNREIYYRCSSDNGASWSAPKRLSWNSGQSYKPKAAVDLSGTVHVVWYDKTVDPTEIFYKNSTDLGATWSAMTRLTWNSESSQTPSIAADQYGDLHVVWDDGTPGNQEIFYKNRK